MLLIVDAKLLHFQILTATGIAVDTQQIYDRNLMTRKRTRIISRHDHWSCRVTLLCNSNNLKVIGERFQRYQLHSAGTLTVINDPVTCEDRIVVFDTICASL